MKPLCTVYLHSECFETSKAVDKISWVGHALPHFRQVRDRIVVQLDKVQIPQLPLRQADLSDFSSIHTKEYLDKLQMMASGNPPEVLPRLSAECLGYEFCLPGYRFGLGGMYAAIDQMKQGILERAYIFALGGHHAYKDWGHGYCLLNVHAAAARYAQEHGFEQILIVDWDIHHGDGTQAIFANDKTVYHISIHNGMDLYMMFQRVHRDGSTVAAVNVGHCNIPLLSTKFSKSDFQNWPGVLYKPEEAFHQFGVRLESLPFSPDLIILFSGYDSHIDDCGKDITNWNNEDFRELTRMILRLSAKVQAPVLSVHGGGYKLPITVSAALAHLDELFFYKAV